MSPDWKISFASGVDAGRLSASTSLTEALRDADIALICVGTPSERNGNLGLGQLHAVCAEIAGVFATARRR
jgi:GDP-mannose 6-dehydrogenase